jgi:hypothetical protein
METQSYSADEARTLDFLKLDDEAARAVVDKLDGSSLQSGIGPLQQRVQSLLYHCP